MQDDFFYSKYKRWIWTLVSFIVLIDFSLMWLNRVPCNDVAARYAPMAEAFADGDWRYAFHPRFGLLFPVLSGSVSWLTGLDGFRSCQIAALTFFFLAVFPLWGIFRRVWNERVAAVGCVMYLLCSHLLRYAFDGLRDNGKTFGVALGVYGVVAVFQNPRQWRGYLSVAAGGAVLTVLRGDGAFFALELLIAIFAVEGFKCRRIPVRSVLAAVLLLVLTSPQLYYNYDLLGYPVPECRHAQLLKRFGIAPLKTPEVELP